MHITSVTFHPHTYPGVDRYPFNLPIFRQTGSIAFNSPVTLFVGENGTGKSTLLEAIAHKCGIHIWRDAERRRLEYNPYEEKFCDYISIEWAGARVPGSFFGSSMFQDFARMLDEWVAADPGQLKYFGGKSLITQSHGQSFMSYFRTRYQIEGLYLLDEPDAALSPRTQLELLEVLASMGAGGHAQFIVATHSPILMACPGSTIYSFDQVPIQQVPYEETEHYQVYRSFFEDRQKYLGSFGTA